MAKKTYQERIGINRLDDDSKSELYKRFEKIGGKAVPGMLDLSEDDDLLTNFIKKKEAAEAEKEKKEIRIIRDLEASQNSKRKKLQSQNQAFSNQNKSNKRKKSRQKFGKKLSSRLSKIEIKQRDNTPISYLAAKLSCIFSGIFTLFGNRVHHRFFSLLLVDYKRYLEENKSILTSLLYQDAEFSKQLRKKLTDLGRPYYFEMLYRLDNLYDEAMFQQIFEITRSRANILKGRRVFTLLFKKLYVLFVYKQVLNDAFHQVLSLEKNFRGLDERMVKSNIAQLERSVQFIFGKFYQKVQTLMNFYYKLYLINGGKEDFETFLNINADERIGYYTRFWKEQEEAEEKKRKEALEKARQEEELKRKRDGTQNIDFESLSPAIQKGMKLINLQVRFGSILKEFQKNRDPRGIFDVNDKVFLISSLLDFFDQQFSFVYLGGKVEYSVFFQKNGNRIDMKNALKDLHAKIGVIYKKVREYVSHLEDEARIRNNPHFSSEENNTQLALIRDRLKDALKFVGYESRKISVDFLKLFSEIISDYKGKKQIIQNPDERLHFRAGVGEKPLLDNLKIIDVIIYAYYYLSAFRFLLTDSDLRPYQLKLKNPRFLILPQEEVEAKPEKMEFVGETEQGISLEKPIDLK